MRSLHSSNSLRPARALAALLRCCLCQQSERWQHGEVVELVLENCDCAIKQARKLEDMVDQLTESRFARSKKRDSRKALRMIL